MTIHSRRTFLVGAGSVSLLAACGNDATNPLAPTPEPPEVSASAVGNVVLPLPPFDVWVPCARDGAGETVRVTGEVHMFGRLFPDASIHGGDHELSHTQLRRLQGFGQITGDRYVGSGLDHMTETIAT